MKRRACWFAVAVLAVYVVAPGRAVAQTTITIRLPVKDVMSLGASSTSLVLPTPNAAAYDGTLIPVSSGTTLTVRSNRAWKVTMSTAASFSFANTGSNSFANPSKPASDVAWDNTNGPFAGKGFLGVSGSNVPFSAGAIGTASAYSPTASATTTLFFKPIWSYVRDRPGTYTLTINLTLSTP